MSENSFKYPFDFKNSILPTLLRLNLHDHTVMQIVP